MNTTAKIGWLVGGFVVFIVMLFLTGSLDPNSATFFKWFLLFAVFSLMFLNKDSILDFLGRGNQASIKMREVFNMVNKDLEGMPGRDKLSWGDGTRITIKSRTILDKSDKPHHFVAFVAPLRGSVEEVALTIYEVDPIFRYWDYVSPVHEEFRNDPFNNFRPFVQHGYRDTHKKYGGPKSFAMKMEGWDDDRVGDTGKGEDRKV